MWSRLRALLAALDGLRTLDVAFLALGRRAGQLSRASVSASCRQAPDHRPRGCPVCLWMNPPGLDPQHEGCAEASRRGVHGNSVVCVSHGALVRAADWVVCWDPGRARRVSCAVSGNAKCRPRPVCDGAKSSWAVSGAPALRGGTKRLLGFKHSMRGQECGAMLSFRWAVRSRSRVQGREDPFPAGVSDARDRVQQAVVEGTVRACAVHRWFSLRFGSGHARDLRGHLDSHS